MPDELAEQIRQAALARGFSSPRAFIREAIRKELRSQSAEAEELENRIAASLSRMANELRKVTTAQQAQFALTDALAKLFLVCVPEPPSDVIGQARSRAMSRYDKFLNSVARSMTGAARAALTELINNGH
jgi:hypothetical protein